MFDVGGFGRRLILLDNGHATGEPIVFQHRQPAATAKPKKGRHFMLSKAKTKDYQKQSVKRLQSVAAVFISASLLLGPGVSTAADSTNSSAAQSPEWLRKSVVYEIFPRNFSPAGDFNGITAHLDELKDLGVNVLWLMPINPIGQKLKKGTIGSPFAVRDYYAVNPNYGTADDFKRLVAGAHQRGMKVMLNIVTRHTAWDNPLITEHPEFYKKDETGKIVSPQPAWTDVAALDYDNLGLRRFMIDVLKFWLKEYNVDGFRCDVAGSTAPIEFWENARAELEAIRPGVIMLADASAKPALLSKAFNLDYSDSLHWAVSRVISGQSPATMMKRSWENTRNQFPPGALHLRYSDNDQTVRAVARFSMQGALAAQVLMFTLDGVPMFYNGMEVGDATESADPSLFEKLPVNWKSGGRPPLREVYSQVAKLRKQYPAFCNDNVTWLENSSPTDVVTFARADDQDEFVVCINLSSRLVAGAVEYPNAEKFKALEIDGMPAVYTTTFPEFRLEGYGFIIFHRTLKEPASPPDKN